ncbi:hypothetical protein M758_1G168400 [Ceratodon purpureus]|nr:hypothetical protein M758_1G168400 [Ceratodon purpureus]
MEGKLFMGEFFNFHIALRWTSFAVWKLLLQVDAIHRNLWFSIVSTFDPWFPLDKTYSLVYDCRKMYKFSTFLVYCSLLVK